MPNHKPNPNLNFKISTLKPTKVSSLPRKSLHVFGQFLVINMQQVKQHTHSLNRVADQKEMYLLG